MTRKAPNPCPDCGAGDRWLGEVFPDGKVPSDVDKKELVKMAVFASMYKRNGKVEERDDGGQDNGELKEQSSGSAVLRIARSGNMISSFHPGAVPCLVCPECGQLTLVTDPTKIRILQD